MIIIAAAIGTGVVPDWLFRDAMRGGVLALGYYLVAWLLHAGTVTGWLPATQAE